MDIVKFIENVNSVNWQKYDDAEYFKYRCDKACYVSLMNKIDAL